MIIPEFTNYSYIANLDLVVSHVSGKNMSANKRAHGKAYYKLKRDDGLWCQVSKSKLLSSCGLKIDISSCSKSIPNAENYFCDKKGIIHSFANFSCGEVLKGNVGGSGYKSVQIVYKGKRRNVEIHQLVCVTHIMSDYIEKGLVCLHADNNKLNNNISNLSVGTYSKNNKDAYADGINKGNGLKKVT